MNNKLNKNTIKRVMLSCKFGTTIIIKLEFCSDIEQHIKL